MYVPCYLNVGNPARFMNGFVINFFLSTKKYNKNNLKKN